MKEYYVKVNNTCENCKFLSEVRFPGFMSNSNNEFEIRKRCTKTNINLGNDKLINCNDFEFDTNIIRPLINSKKFKLINMEDE